MAPRGFLRIPAEHYFPVRFLVAIAPWVVVLNSVASAEDSHPLTLATWALIHLVTLGVASIPLFVAKRVLSQREISTVPLWFLVFSGAAAGAVKGISTSTLEFVLNLTEYWSQTVLVRGVGATIAGVWLLVLAGYSQMILTRLREARSEVVAQNVAVRLAAERDLLRLDLDEPLGRLVSLRERLSQGRSEAVSDDLRATVDHTIRPLSRALWSKENARYPEIRAIELFRLAVQSKSLPAHWAALIWASTSFTALAVPMGLVASATYNLVSGVLAMVVFWGLGRLALHSLVAGLVLVSALSLGVVFFGSWIASLLVADLYQVISAFDLAVGALWMVLVVAGVAVVSAGREMAQIIERDLESHGTRALIRQRAENEALELTSRTVATRLHGEIQSKLLTIAALIDEGRTPSSKLISDIDQAIAAIQALKTSPGFAAHSSPHEESVEYLINTWDGLMRVEVSPEADLLLPQIALDSPGLFDVLREALANAHRHGRATQVAIDVEKVDGSVWLSVSDNGYGPREGRPGLGTALLAQWTDEWSLTPTTDGGSRLRVKVG